MITVNLKSIVAKLNTTCRSALEGAAGLCLSRTNYNLEIEHWLAKLIEGTGTDVHLIFEKFGVDIGRVTRDLTSSMDKFKTGNTRPPVLSPETVDLARDAWLIASVEFGEPRTRSGHILYSLLADQQRAMMARSASSEFGKISAEKLLAQLASIVENSNEAGAAGASATGGGAAAVSDGRQAAGAGSGALGQYTVDLTAQAKQGKMDPVLGRDAEVRQIVDILMRRRQNNPILTGEAGVGKTAVVEGFAQRIVSGDVPPPLRNVTLRSLDLGLLQAGASIKGEFENRLRGVIDEVKASATPIILFIDEAHMMIGAGGQAGQGDAANLLKPALARGDLRTIAATTWAEYKKYFEKDPALTRRFQVVKVEEPTEAVAVSMMQGLVGKLEKHHNVNVLDEAVTDSVRLSSRYITGRQLPDKCVSLLDTACARVAIAHHDVPPRMEALQREIEDLTTRIGILEREHEAGAEHQERIDELGKARETARGALEQVTARWKQEAELVKKIVGIRRELGQAVGQNGNPTEAAKDDSKSQKGDAKAPAKKPGGEDAKKTEAKADGKTAALTAEERKSKRGELQNLMLELKALQGEEPLISPVVDKQAVAEVVSGWTGIPVGRMVSDEINTVLKLRDMMEERIVGQSHALEAIAQSIRTSRADLTDPNKPIGVFLLPGPSGVGKTETALTLAELLYGGEQNINTINMSEFKEEHKVSLLMGSPPGYVGYGEGGILTEAVRRKPYSVVLLDEMEKAHPGVQDIFYQVFDKGMLRDGEGRDIDFKNTVIIMTSNAASDMIMKLTSDPDTAPDSEGLAKAIYPELLKHFKPAFLGRVTVVPFFPLKDDVLRGIVRLKLGKIVRRIRANYGAELAYDGQVVEEIANRCTEVESGARNIDNIVSRTLLPELSAEVLSRLAEGTTFSKVSLGVGKDGKFSYSIS